MATRRDGVTDEPTEGDDAAAAVPPGNLNSTLSRGPDELLLSLFTRERSSLFAPPLFSFNCFPSRFDGRSIDSSLVTQFPVLVCTTVVEEARPGSLTSAMSLTTSSPRRKLFPTSGRCETRRAIAQIVHERVKAAGERHEANKGGQTSKVEKDRQTGGGGERGTWNGKKRAERGSISRESPGRSVASRWWKI